MGLDTITEEEARMVFKYLDSEGSGEIGFEQFKNIMYDERPQRVSPDRLFGMTMSTLVPIN
jgi:hypothetical protein